MWRALMRKCGGLGRRRRPAGHPGSGVPCLRSLQSWAVLPKCTWQVGTWLLRLPHGRPSPVPYSFLSPILPGSCQHPSVPAEADLPVSDTGSVRAWNSAPVMMPRGIFSWQPQELRLACRAQHAGRSQSRAVWLCSVGRHRPSPSQSCRASRAGASRVCWRPVAVPRASALTRAHSPGPWAGEAGGRAGEQVLSSSEWYQHGRRGSARGMGGHVLGCGPVERDPPEDDSKP